MITNPPTMTPVNDDMGCDGGSIPRRSEMVKTKGKSESVNESDGLKTQWTCCFISKKPLERPVVACKLGRLYNKESVVMFLLNRDGEVDPTLASELSHLKSLKGSFINCNSLRKEESSEYFVCPVTGREMNGKSRFYVTKSCGCVLSEQAINQFPDTKACLVCERKDFSGTEDLIPLYPKGEELDKLKVAILTEEGKPRKRPLAAAGKVAAAAAIEDSKSPANLLKEIKANGSEIGTLKKTKVTESLYIKK